MKELALLNQLYLPVSSPTRLIILQLLTLPLKWKIINVISYLSAILLVVLLMRNNQNFMLIICGGIFVFGDHLCFKIAFKQYLKNFKLKSSFYNSITDYVRYSVFRNNLIDKGYYEYSFIIRALKSLEVELLEFHSHSSIKNDIFLVLLSTLIASMLDNSKFFKMPPIIIVMISYVLLKISISIYFSHNNKREKYELAQFISRIKIELEEKEIGGQDPTVSAAG